MGIKGEKKGKHMIDSFQKNKKGILLMLVSSVCVCIGQLLWKLSAEEGILVLLAGFAFYGVGAMVMILTALGSCPSSSLCSA